MMHRSWRRGVAVALGLSFTMLPALEAVAQSRSSTQSRKVNPRPAIVGQAILEKASVPSASGRRSRNNEIPIIILRGGQRIGTVTNYEPLYPNDEVFLKAGSTEVVKLEVFGRDDVRIGSGTSGSIQANYKLPEAKSGAEWTAKGFLKLVSQVPNIFDPLAARPPVFTTPNGTKGTAIAPVAPTHWLPAEPQALRVTGGRVMIPVVWTGGPALVRFSRQCKLVVEEEFSAQPGFVALRTSRLSAGAYCIDVWPVDARHRADPKAGFSIPVSVTIEEPAVINEETAVLAAVDKLKGAPGSRLQGLVELETQSQTSFKARALYSRLTRGDLPAVKPPRRGR